MVSIFDDGTIVFNIFYEPVDIVDEATNPLSKDLDMCDEGIITFNELRQRLARRHPHFQRKRRSFRRWHYHFQPRDDIFDEGIILFSEDIDVFNEGFIIFSEDVDM